ncbi:MAG: sugar transferase [Ramlibacter sp.]|nr:sugar transferase [Ramlibacter sp.]
MIDVFSRRFQSFAIEFTADSLVCFVSALLAAWQFAPSSLMPGRDFLASGAVVWAGAFAILMSMMYSFVGLYRRGTILFSARTHVQRTFLAVLTGSAIAFVALAISGHRSGGTALFGVGILYVSAGALAVRGVSYVARKSRVGLKRILIVGTGEEAQAVALDIRNSTRSAALVVGFFPAGTQEDAAGNPQNFSPENSLEQVVQEHRIDEIVVAMREQRGGAVPMSQLLACRIRGINVLDLAGFYERAHGEVPTDSLKASWLVYGRGFVQSPLRAFIKRAVDISFSLVLLVLAAPLMVLAATAIRLESPGSIIYTQERVGRGGTLFKCRKFRSMRTDAEKDGVARWATKNDSRVTRVGSLIRKTRIDELPQLFSVLRGNMSLVGPRPERPSFVATLKETIPYYDIRHSVKPGVTGWAQVRFGYCATIDDSRRKHQFDLYYVKNNSLALDLLVMIETVSVVLFREGSQ